MVEMVEGKQRTYLVGQDTASCSNEFEEWKD